MFANCTLGGQDFGMPDVCKTPAPPAPFVPVPYPNFAMKVMGVPFCVKHMILCVPAHHMGTMVPISSGDEAGVMGGIISQIFIGPSRNTLGSFKVLHEGLPATRMLDMTMQNLCNVPAGATLVPSQTKVMIMG